MTLPDERYRAVMETEKFLLELMTDNTVPATIRHTARSLLKHYPTKYEMNKVVELYPQGFQKEMEPVTRMMMSYDIEQKENKNVENL